MIKRGFKKLMAEANAVIETISVHDAVQMRDRPDVLFVDVRETVERQETGTIPGSVHAPRGFLELIADPEGPMHNQALASGKSLLLFCGTGGRSTLAAKTLVDMGLENVASLAGGFNAWKEAGGPIEK